VVLVCLGFASTAFTNSSGVPTPLTCGCGYAALRPSVQNPSWRSLLCVKFGFADQ
jgi:hypothetical protein